MKNIKSHITLIAILFITLNSFGQKASIDKNEAINILKTKILKHEFENKNIYISKNILNANSIINTIYTPLSASAFDSWFIFIDDKPFASWSHPCRYVFINVETGAFSILNQINPPRMDIMEIVHEVKVTETGKLFDFSKHSKNICTTTNDYAVIISGGAEPSWNWERYWNHCSAIYSALINIYGFDEDHIFVLMSDGTDPANDRHLIGGGYDSSPLDLDNDGDDDVQFAATIANINAVFSTLSGILTMEDNLFIYTTDHGGQDSGNDVYINLWNENMEDNEFAAAISPINAGTINFCLVQCHSGGFIDDLQSANRVITTSCRADEGATAMPDQYIYISYTVFKCK